MRSILFFIGCFVSIEILAQELPLPFSVKYIHGYIEPKDSLQISSFIKKHRYHRFPNYEITILDTAAIIVPFMKEREIENRIVGTGFRSHTMFVDFKHRLQYFQSDPYGLEKYLVEESYRDAQFDLVNDSISLLGYTCYKAVLKNANQTNAQIIMWYAPSLLILFLI